MPSALTAPLLVLPAVAAPAHAADTWVGAQLTSGVQQADGRTGTVLSQGEVDVRVEHGDVSFRLDLDYHLDPWWFGQANAGYSFVPHYPFPPEIAVLQIGGGPGPFVRLGVTNPPYGTETWDEKDNDFPTYSEGWSLYGSQSLGLQQGLRTDGGNEVSAFLGYDPAWNSPTFGGCVTAVDRSERFGTWSGVYWLTAQSYGQLVTSSEAYPTPFLDVLLDLHGGLAGAGWVAGGQVALDVHPVGRPVIAGAARVEQIYESAEAARVLGFRTDRTTVAAAIRSRPLDAIRVALEGREAWPVDPAGELGGPYFTATLLVTVASGLEPEDPFGVD